MPKSKTEKLKPRVIDCIDRLKKLVELDAPAVIIGTEAWAVFATVLAAYGQSAGSTMIQRIRDGSLHARGVCSHEDCTRYVERPGIGMCAPCLKTLDLEDEAGPV